MLFTNPQHRVFIAIGKHTLEQLETWANRYHIEVRRDTRSSLPSCGDVFEVDASETKWLKLENDFRTYALGPGQRVDLLSRNKCVGQLERDAELAKIKRYYFVIYPTIQ